MRKRAIAAFLISIYCLSLVFAGGTTKAQEEDSIWEDRDFDQRVLAVNLVISDVLYAGFSSKYINSVVPDFSLLENVEYFTETTDTNDAIYTKPFFIFCLVSTPRSVSVKLDFAPGYEDPSMAADKTGLHGLLKEKTQSRSAVTIPCMLSGAPTGLLEVKPSGSPITVPWSYPDPSSGVIMSMKVLKKDIPDEAINAYETKLQMTITIGE